MHLAAVINDLERAHIDWLHFDLEDGHFVPVMTLGTRLISELRPLTRLPFDVHLMVANPETMVPVVAELGGNSISDGGIAAENVREVVQAGATVIVSGRGIFRPGDIMENVQQLRHAAGES